MPAVEVVTFSDTIPDARVVLGPLSGNGPQPVSLRVREVTDQGFEFQVDEWDYLDGWHMEETLSWMAVSAGTHTLDDGRTISAGRTTAESEDDQTVALTGFDGTPIVLTQVSSDNGNQAVVTRLGQAEDDSFTFRMQEEEANDGWHVQETVDWVAIEGGTAGAVDAVTVAEVTDLGTTATIEEVDGELGVLAAMQTFNGNNTAGVRLLETGPGSVTLKIEEETSLDDETFHLPEAVGLVTAETGLHDLA
ncbi:MAG: hypothetical protein AAFW46_18440 [Pseudomonadota bacterium]